MAFYHWFQSTYDKLDRMEWSPKMKKMMQDLNDMMPKEISKAILKYIETTYKKTSKDLAEKVLADILKVLGGIIDGK